ncbi:MAG: leucyl aminopeptidase [Xanthomonadales bacterium]|nr:leucyl aminopeptidase [Xanthomonadales bacterium]
MRMYLDNSKVCEISTGCLVIAVIENGPLGPHAAAVNDATGGVIEAMLESGDIQAKTAKTTLLHRPAGIAAERVLVVGMGEAEKLSLARFHRACNAAGKVLRDHPVRQCHVCLQEVDIKGVDALSLLRQAALAVHRGNYMYTVTKQRKDDAPAPLESASFQAAPDMQAAISQAEGLAAGFEKAKTLGDLPPNICNPSYLAQDAAAIAASYANVELEVLEENDMSELGMDALMGVSRGSANAAKLIVLRYTGADAGQKPVAFIGKGITFDSGGLSLKSGENMMQMKFDMCGAAGVIGAFVACAKMQLKVNLVCIVAAVENMPDGDACRPGDVLTSMSGKTIEVLNTDAEGRLVLCDAITYSEKFEPECVIDVATLTGACVVALGHHASGLMSNDDELADALLAAGDAVVDRAWRLPIWEEYQSQLDSPYADMKNIGGMPAGVLTAGCFLSRFAEDLRWAHIDVAGTAWKWGGDDGATGRPVGLLTQFLINRAG